MTPPVAAEVRDLLALHLIPGLGPRLTAALLKRFGTAAAVLRAGASELQEVPHVGSRLAESLGHALQHVDVDAELARMARHEVHVLALGSPEYPPSLAEIGDPPQLLYVRGTVESRDRRAVGIVGSRHGTAYGKKMAERLANGLVRAGYTVISGLARGIDGAAHRAALQAGGRTLAVLAGGLSRIYPPEHADLAREVAQSGALLSEAAMEMEPMAGMFPARNRLISGLSQGVVIVEAAARSGALITASHAADQGRTVFALPGPIDSAASAGTNELLRKGAILVRGVEDIQEELEGLPSPVPPKQAPQEPPELNDQERRVWDVLASAPRHVDEMAQKTQLQVPQLAATLHRLEMRKLIRRLTGNRYERC